MFASLQDEESMRLTGTHASFSLEQIVAWCERVATEADRVDYAIIANESGAYVGEVVLNEIDEDNRSANFRIALAAEAQFGKGYGSEASHLLLHYGFEKLGLHRTSLEVYRFNPRAIHVYEKLGFKHEGVRRDALRWEGEYIDALQMSILEHEFTLKP